MAPTGGGYFAFDTNAEAVANRIGSSMSKIQSELSRVTARTAVGSNFDTDGLFRSIAQVNKGFEQLGETFAAGGLKPAQYLNQFRDQAVKGLAEVERSLATQVSRQPAALLDKTNLGKLGRDAYAAYNQGLVQQAKELVASDPRFGRSKIGQNLARDLQAELSAEASARSRRLLSTSGLDQEDAARLRAYYESQAALIKSDRLGAGRLSQIPGLAAATRGGDRELTNTAGDPAYRPRRDQLNAINQQLTAEKQLAKFQNETHDAQLKAARAEATEYDRQRNALAIKTQGGSSFGKYGRLGDDLYAQSGPEGMRKLVTGSVEYTKALTAEQQQLARTTREESKRQQAQLRKSGSLSDNFASGLFGRGFNASGNTSRPSIGEGIRNELATLGTVARYSGVYAVLSAVTSAIKDTAGEVMDFRDSLTDLGVALNVKTVDSGLVNQLQQIAVISGSNTGAALDAAARGARAFGDVAGQQGSDVARAGTDIADAATKVALITSKALPDATGDVIAIASAFGLAAGQANQVVDAISAAKDFGGDPANISQGLANFATTAGAAGFTLGEAANALSLVIARTDQSGQSAATRLSRITSILAGTTGRSVISDLNAAGLRDKAGNPINPEASVRDQLQQIAQAYQKAAPELQGKIRSSLGGTSNLRELLPLLEPGAVEGTSLLDKVLGEGGNQAGRGEAEVRRRTEDLVGILRKFKGDVSAIQVNLFRSGAFDGVVLAFKGLEPALNVVGRLLGLIDQLPDKLKIVLGVLLDIQLALVGLKALGFIQSSNLLNTFTPKRGGAATIGAALPPDLVRKRAEALDVQGTNAALRRVAADQAAAIAAGERAVADRVAAVDSAKLAVSMKIGTAAQVQAAEASLAAAQADLYEASASGEAALANATGSRLKGAGGVIGSAAPFIALTAAIYGLQTVFQAVDKAREIDKSRNKGREAILGSDLSDPASLKKAADALRANRADLIKSQQGTVSGFLVKNERDTEVRQSHVQEANLRAMAKAITVNEQHALALNKTTIFANAAVTSTEDVAAALAKLSAAGVDSVGQFDLMIAELLKKPGTDGKLPLPTDDAPKFAAAITQNLLDGIVAGAKQGKGKKDDLVFTQDVRHSSGGGQSGVSTSVTKEEIDVSEVRRRTAARFSQIQGAALKKLESFGIPEGTAPTDAQLQAVVKAALDASGLDKFGADYGKLRTYLNQRILGQAAADLKAAAMAGGEQPLSPKAALDRATDIGTAYDSSISSLPKSDIDGRKARGQQYLQGLRNLISSAEKGGGSAADPHAMEALARKYAVAAETVSTDLITDMEDLRKAKQSQTDSKAKIRAIGRQAFEDEVAVALENDNVAALTEIFNLASRAQVNAAIAAVQAKVDADNAAIAAARQTAAAIAQYAGHLDGDNPNDAKKIAGARRGIQPTPDQQKRAGDLDQAKAARDRATPRKNGASDFTEPDSSSSSKSLTAAQIEAARLDAQVSPSDSLAQAKADLVTAQANLDAASKADDPGAYYAAQKALRKAKYDVAAKEESLSASARDVRAARVGGSLAKANADLKTAAEEMTQYRKGTEEYNQHLITLINAQQAAAEAAANAKFTKLRANSDLTDEVAQAKIARQEAEAKLARDKKAGRTGALDQDRIDVKAARNAEEQAAFDRGLKDIQTKEQMGQISHAAYIRYLQSEHDRLTAIKHKTQQQVDQLNEIDAAMKAAADQLSGQFNLGDIKVPTPYEARTAVNASSVNIAGQRSGSTQTINIQVDGADTGQILTVLQRVLGPLATQRSTTTSNRKGA